MKLCQSFRICGMPFKEIVRHEYFNCIYAWPGYDNVSNMKGKLSGVQQHIREFHPRACYITCCSHSLKLMDNDAAMHLEKWFYFV